MDRLLLYKILIPVSYFSYLKWIGSDFFYIFSGFYFLKKYKTTFETTQRAKLVRFRQLDGPCIRFSSRRLKSDFCSSSSV